MSRTLTVQDYWRTYQRPWHQPASRIRLCGVWLTSAGFQPGDRVNIQVDSGRLVIERIEEK